VSGGRSSSENRTTTSVQDNRSVATTTTTVEDAFNTVLDLESEISNSGNTSFTDATAIEDVGNTELDNVGNTSSVSFSDASTTTTTINSLDGGAIGSAFEFGEASLQAQETLANQAFDFVNTSQGGVLELVSDVVGRSQAITGQTIANAVGGAAESFGASTEGIIRTLVIGAVLIGGGFLLRRALR
jgi:hypothetical protein